MLHRSGAGTGAGAMDTTGDGGTGQPMGPMGMRGGGGVASMVRMQSRVAEKGFGLFRDFTRAHVLTMESLFVDWRPRTPVIATLGAIALIVLGTSMSWWRRLLACVIPLSYLGAGYVLDDIFDHKVDKEEHPQRPLAAGKVSVIATGMTVIPLFQVSMMLCALYGMQAFLTLFVALIPVVCSSVAFRVFPVLGRLLLAMACSMAYFFVAVIDRTSTMGHAGFFLAILLFPLWYVMDSLFHYKDPGANWDAHSVRGGMRTVVAQAWAALALAVFALLTFSLGFLGTPQSITHPRVFSLLMALALAAFAGILTVMYTHRNLKHYATLRLVAEALMLTLPVLLALC